MTESPLTAAEGPAALATFVRGVERRGALFADLHSGDAVLSEQAYAVTLRHFRGQALGQHYTQWQRLFWRTLAASPQLRQGAANPAWSEPFAALARMQAGARAVVLLRMVGGLTEADSAAALGVRAESYRRALHQALPRAADGQPDLQAWRTLAEAAAAALHEMPAERLAHLARLREAAMQGRRPELIGALPPPQVESPTQPPPRRLLRGLSWAGLAACAVGLIASFVWPGAGDTGDPRIHVRPLAAAQNPASRYDAASALLTEPDFELLAAPDPQPPEDDPAFYAWYAAERMREAAGFKPDAGMRDPESQPEPPVQQATQPESIDAP